MRHEQWFIQHECDAIQCNIDRWKKSGLDLSDKKRSLELYLCVRQVSVFLRAQVPSGSGMAGGEITGGDLAVSGAGSGAEAGDGGRAGGLRPLHTLQTHQEQRGTSTSRHHGQGRHQHCV